MTKILVGIPMITGADHCRKAIESVLNQENIELLIIDNNSEPDVKEMLKEYHDRRNVHITVNPKNVYVNPSWNQIMNYFLWYSDCEYLVIMNSDLIMHKDWSNVCRNYWGPIGDHKGHMLLPVIVDTLSEDISDRSEYAEAVFSGTPGIFITLNREQAKRVNPIDSTIKIWFGDNWIFDTLRKHGDLTVIPNNLLATHAWSSTISRVPEAYDIIEQDKIAWEKIKYKVYG